MEGGSGRNPRIREVTAQVTKTTRDLQGSIFSGNVLIMQEVDDSAYWSDLERRCAFAIRQIPGDRIHLFCASCAERFFAGYAVWLAKEKLVNEPAASLPSPEFVRRAIDLCWAAGVGTEAENLLETLIRTMPGDNEQPIFKSPLDDYFVEPWLVRLGLSSVLNSQASLLEPWLVAMGLPFLVGSPAGFGIAASAAALDFHNQLLDRRREMAGIGPAFDDPQRDLREFASDPGALAESAIQIDDAQQLRLAEPDLDNMRKRSADHGQQVLQDVVKLVGQ